MSAMSPGSTPDAPPPAPGGWLARLEHLGNRLPDPVTLFLLGWGIIIALSGLAVAGAWQVTKTTVVEGVSTQTVVQARSLMSADGLWWSLSHLVENFVRFPPLGIVLVGMLGIGVAERSGLLAVLLQRLLLGLAAHWLTPAVVLVGVLSSVALDAGYVVLPPLAAALYQAAGRSPLVGIAAVFAGVSAGFSANLIITALDPLLAGFTQAGAQILAPDYRVAVTANWWFMIASTGVLTLTAWWLTARFVEPRMGTGTGAAAEVPVPVAGAGELSDPQRRGLRAALVSLLVVAALVAAATWWPGGPLAGQGEHFPRLIEVTVPLLLLAFLVPGLVYGRVAGTLPNDREVARALGATMAALGPYIVLAFVAAQFIEAFKYSRLGELLALAGGQFLAQAAWPAPVLILAFIFTVMAANLLMGSASAKYAFFAPVFVPMFMQAGVSPELTQAAYRVGDSVTNIITPLNPYMIIILAAMQRYRPAAGLGTLLSLMMPYALGFAVVWTLLLLAWMLLGWPLGPGGALTYGV